MSASTRRGREERSTGDARANATRCLTGARGAIRDSTRDDRRALRRVWGRVIDAGIEGLGDADLVAILLGAGAGGASAAEISAAVLENYGGLAGLAREGLGPLAERSGIGVARALRLVAAIELGRRVAAESVRSDRLRFDDPRAVDAWARPRLVGLDHEELWVLVLDRRNGLRAARRVAMGGGSAMSVTAREPLGIALREGGHAIVLVHNHPSGDPRPSDQDVEFTRQLAHASALVGIPLVDHVVIAQAGAISMLSQGLLGAPPTTGDGSIDACANQSDQT